jgi:hypothetical protein
MKKDKNMLAILSFVEKNNANTITTRSMTGVIAIVAAALALATTTTVIIPSAAYADQSATYQSSSGTVTITADCTKDPTDPFIDCKQFKEFFGHNPNTFAREECEALSGGEQCHRQK